MTATTLKHGDKFLTQYQVEYFHKLTKNLLQQLRKLSNFPCVRPNEGNSQNLQGKILILFQVAEKFLVTSHVTAC
jgi:hypothetical protein